VKSSTPEIIELLEDREHVLLQQGPTCLEEFSGESVRSWCLASRQAFDSSLDFGVSERLVELS
jgi:hypothetical protein